MQLEQKKNVILKMNDCVFNGLVRQNPQSRAGEALEVDQNEPASQSHLMKTMEKCYNTD